LDDERIQPVGKRPLRVGLVLLLAGLPLTAMLLTACGGSDDHAKVEASLRHYLSTLDPQACLDSAFCQQGVFPLGAGVPHVKENSCKKIHTDPLHPARLPGGVDLDSMSERQLERLYAGLVKLAALPDEEVRALVEHLLTGGQDA
jgi:hypothetical protein